MRWTQVESDDWFAESLYSSEEKASLHFTLLNSAVRAASLFFFDFQREKGRAGVLLADSCTRPRQSVHFTGPCGHCAVDRATRRPWKFLFVHSHRRTSPGRQSGFRYQASCQGPTSAGKGLSSRAVSSARGRTNSRQAPLSHWRMERRQRRRFSLATPLCPPESLRLAEDATSAPSCTPALPSSFAPPFWEAVKEACVRWWFRFNSVPTQRTTESKTSATDGGEAEAAVADKKVSKAASRWASNPKFLLQVSGKASVEFTLARHNDCWGPQKEQARSLVFEKSSASRRPSLQPVSSLCPSCAFSQDASGCMIALYLVRGRTPSVEAIEAVTDFDVNRSLAGT